MEHFVEVGKRREGETDELHSPGQRPAECSDAGRRSEGMKRTKDGYATVVRKMASVALDVADESCRSKPEEYLRVVRCVLSANETSSEPLVRRTTTGNIPSQSLHGHKSIQIVYGYKLGCIKL